MHSRGVVHSDLKPYNIFERLNASAVDEVMIGDFGMATDKQWDMQQYCGTAKYMAPEVVAVKSDGASYTAAMDVWGLGVIAYELLRGYQSRVEFDFLRARAFLIGFASCEAKDLIQGMLVVEQSKRTLAALSALADFEEGHTRARNRHSSGESALASLHAKCGSLDAVREEPREGSRMRWLEGISPNGAPLLERGMFYAGWLSREHYRFVVELLGRCGEALLRSMPLEPHG
ncbi:serine/threonine-protein kinase AtPK1/AtPK6-like [Selaginella moellendorffii]|uniref:serine/threonine-protein kinase AtPK1/AtPK6-like n=1 Tax=Selaginella moellendorffii TaxID=88036 RepID=UPI000D1CA42E|nr:serine/threonine-protein kinase AtPK1/AtPK6-like [Selaginella moellendorffii]|eukprot:XP_024521750.1 serine/threonine-protein kinase AtPK1/AtPK6-like [Selaginella moellendorffii]